MEAALLAELVPRRLGLVRDLLHLVDGDLARFRARVRVRVRVRVRRLRLRLGLRLRVHLLDGDLHVLELVGCAHGQARQRGSAVGALTLPLPFTPSAAVGVGVAWRGPVGLGWAGLGWGRVQAGPARRQGRLAPSC